MTGPKLLENVDTMRRLYRMTLQMPEMDSTSRSAPIGVNLKLSLLQELLMATYSQRRRYRGRGAGGVTHPPPPNNSNGQSWSKWN